MGYRPEAKTYNLQFADYPGLEMSVRGTSMGKLFDLVKYRSLDVAKMDETVKRDLFGFFASRIVTWNVEHPDLETEAEQQMGMCSVCGLPAGALLPTTADGMFCLDVSFIFAIVNGWTEGISQVNFPKGRSSNNGESPDIASAMMRLGELQSQ